MIPVINILIGPIIFPKSEMAREIGAGRETVTGLIIPCFTDRKYLMRKVKIRRRYRKCFRKTHPRFGNE